MGFIVAYINGRRPFYSVTNTEEQKKLWKTIVEEAPLPCITDSALYNPHYIHLIELGAFEENHVIRIKFVNNKEVRFFINRNSDSEMPESFAQLYLTLADYQSWRSDTVPSDTQH